MLVQVRYTHVAISSYTVENQKDVVERNGTEEVEEKPRPNVMFRYQPRVDDNLLAVVLLHNTCGNKRILRQTTTRELRL